MKKTLTLVVLLFFAASLSAQSVVDLAKREKARRAGLKGHAAVIKNHDLLRVKKQPALEVSIPGQETEEVFPVEDQSGQPGAATPDAETSVSPSGSGAPGGRRITPRVAAPGPAIMGEGAAPDQAASSQALEAQFKAAQDLVDLLTIKMNALRQQYEAQDAMVPGYVIQQQMDETGQRLAKAQAQEARIRAEMTKKGLGKKDSGSADR